MYNGKRSGGLRNHTRSIHHGTMMHESMQCA